MLCSCTTCAFDQLISVKLARRWHMACDLIPLHSQQWFRSDPQCSSLYPSEVCNVSQLRFSYQQSGFCAHRWCTCAIPGSAAIHSSIKPAELGLAAAHMGHGHFEHHARQLQRWGPGRGGPGCHQPCMQHGAARGRHHRCWRAVHSPWSYQAHHSRRGAASHSSHQVQSHCKLIYSLHLVPFLSATELSGILYWRRGRIQVMCLYCCAIVYIFRILHCGDAP